MSHAAVSTTARGSWFRVLTLVVAALTALGLAGVISPQHSEAAPVGASFLITPLAFSFEAVPVGSVSASQSVTITNVSGSSAAVHLSLQSVAMFRAGTSDCGASLAAGASCHLPYQFAPTATGSYTAAVNDTFSGQPFTLNLSGNGINRFRVSPTGFDFGTVAVGSVSPRQVVTIKNVGSTSAPVDVSLQDIDAFSAGPNDCGASLAAGATCHIPYYFAPTLPRSIHGIADGTVDGQPFTLNFAGNGGAAPPPGTLFAITPTAFDFGDVPVGSTSPQQVVTITNISGASVVMSGAGGGAGFDGGEQTCQGLTLAAGASCHMYYQYTPTTVAPQPNTTSGNWNGQQFSFAFTGNGTNQFLITPTSFDFGDVPVGSSSAQQVVTVKNVGTSSVVMSGAGGGAGFDGGEQTCQGLTLAAGASCHMYYQYTPTTVGPQPNTTSGNWNGQQFSFAFTGNGINAPVVTAVSPSAGPAAGGTSVTITGTGFNGATKVSFGSVAASFGLKSSTTIVAVAPAQSAGTRDITVRTGSGTSAAVAADKFTYQASPPTVTAISPSSGPTSGGTSVTITGTGFTGATKVSFGSVAASFGLKSSTTIVAVAPAQSAGTRDITVRTPGGTSAAVAADRFTNH